MANGMTDTIAITILVPYKNIRTPDSEVITFPRVAGEPLDQVVKEIGAIEVEGLQYEILEVKSEYEEVLDQLIKDRFNEE